MPARSSVLSSFAICGVGLVASTGMQPILIAFYRYDYDATFGLHFWQASYLHDGVQSH